MGRGQEGTWAQRGPSDRKDSDTVDQVSLGEQGQSLNFT